jgi:hypothetical protein
MTSVKFFGNRGLKEILDSILKFNGREVCVDQLYNHLRHYRAMWVHVCRLKMLEEVRWVEKTLAIMMDDDAYYSQIKVRTVHLLFHFIHYMSLACT